MNPRLQWDTIPASRNVCELSVASPYVISHRTRCFTCSYRPPGKHVHVAQCETLEQAKQAAQLHHDLLPL